VSKFLELQTKDVRFPTSRDLDGSDAMNPEPDYSAAYVVLVTDADDGLEGHGFAFTTGRGNDIQTAAIQALAPWIVGRDVEDVLSHLGDIGRELQRDSQLRWLGPEKGVIHMAVSAVLNALWDLRAKREGKPLWKLLADLSPEQIVDIVDFRHISDALTPEEALALLRRSERGRAEREAQLRAQGYPAYTTTPGWLGYTDEKLARLSRQAVSDGFDLIKLKVGASRDEDVRRLAVAREAVGPHIRLAIDANQRWEVNEAIEWVNELAPYEPYWIEEPVSPDDVLGHATVRKGVAPVKVATGEHAQNRVTFKQLFQAGAIDVAQIDACRVGGVNENVAILLMAAKYGIPVCPHAGGVGLCELVRHLSMFDFVAVSGTWEDRRIEYVDHLHEHFLDPAVIESGRYAAPVVPGYSAQMRDQTLIRYAYPDGPVWHGHEVAEDER
jgi:L-fuconate dehydratase